MLGPSASIHIIRIQSDTGRINRRMTFTASHSLSVQIVYRYLKFGGVGLSCQLNTPFIEYITSHFLNKLLF